MAEQLNHGEWKGNTAGSTWMHRTLIASFRIMNLRFVYLGMAVFVVPMYMLFAHQGYITMYHYFRQRQGIRATSRCTTTSGSDRAMVC